MVIIYYYEKGNDDSDRSEKKNILSGKSVKNDDIYHIKSNSHASFSSQSSNNKNIK